MSYKLLTNLLFEPRGKHNPSLTYNIKDTVMSEDGSKVYFALDNVPAGIPLTDTNYWMLQMDLSASKNAMDTAAANARTQTDATIASANTRVEDMMGKAAEAVTSVADYATKVGMRVKGETKITKGNPMTIYPDGGSLLKVQTDIPIKQLGNGDPYPAGSRKNLCPPLSVVKTESGATFTPNADGSVTVSGTATAQSAVGTQQFVLKAGTYTVSGAPVGGAIGSYDIYVFKADGTGTIARSYNGINETFTISNDTNVALAVRVPAGAVDTSKVFWPMIEAGSVATAFQPYSNIRQFVGYSKLDLNAVGKNLLSLKKLTNTVINRVNATIYDNEIDLSPNDGGTGFQQWYGKMTIPESWHGKILTYSIQSSANGSSASVLPKSFLIENDANGNEIGIAVNLTAAPGVASSGSFVVKENTASFTILFRADQYQMFPTGAHMWFGRIQLEESPVMTAYMPYQGTFHTVQLGKNTYQGHYDWLTGKFRAEWNIKTLDGTESYGVLPDNLGTCNRFRIDLPETLTDSAEILCTHFKQTVGDKWVYSGEDVDEWFGECAITSGYIRVLLPAKTRNEAQAYLAAQYAAGTPVQFAWKLATPIETQLAPNVITAVEDGGVNYIYGDAELTVEWVKPLETSLTEHSNAKVDANNEALLMDVAKKERSVGNPIVINDAVANVAFPHVETVLMPKQAGSGDPYPAGGGKNLCNPDEFTQGDLSEGRYLTNSVETNNVSGYVPVSPNTTYTRSSNCVPGSREIAFFDADKNYLSRAFGDTFTTPDGCYFVRLEWEATYPLAECWFQLELGSVATEYAPYSNIRPITGYDVLELNVVGKNLLNNVRYYDSTHADIRAQYDSPLLLKAGVKYVLSTNFQADGLFFVDAAGNGSLEAQYLLKYQYEIYALEYTPTRDIECIFVAIFNSGVPDGATIQLEVGSTTAHTTYQGSLHTVQLGETVYGGHYNWLTGKLMAEWVCLGFDGSNILWEANNGGTDTLFYLPTFFHNNIPTAKMGGRCICSHAQTVGEPPVNQIGCQVSTTTDIGIIYLNLGVQTGAYGFNQYVAENGVQIAYELSTPIEIQLDPTRITTIPGTNTIFGDGEFTIDWFKSYKKVAEERENLLLDSFTDKAELSGNPIVMTPVGGIPFDSVVTEFAPKQAGSGDPYPAGGGKNLFPPCPAFSRESKGITITSDGNGKYTMKGTASGVMSVVVDLESQVTLGDVVVVHCMNNVATDAASISYYRPDGSQITWTTLNVANRIQNNPTLPNETIAKLGFYVADGKTVDITYTPMILIDETPTAFQPYSNIRPITGWDKLELNHAGKNLLPNNSSTQTINGITFTVNRDGSITANGTATANAILSLVTSTSNPELRNVLMGNQITISGCPSGGSSTTYDLRIFQYADANTFLMDHGSGITATFTNAELPFNVAILIRSGVSVSNLVFRPQIELGSTASDFQPYTNTLHTVQIGQTVYGGKFDWLTGKFAKTHALFTGYTNMVYNSRNNAGDGHIFYVVGDFVRNGAVSSILANSTANPWEALSVNTMRIDDGYLIVCVPNSITTPGELAAYMEGQMIVYKLATPIEIQLTPTEILALSGVNTLYGDGDTITAKFRQSKDVDILKRLSALETLMTNQTKGE